MDITVIGAGGWGTTLANLLADKGYNVGLWVREKELLDIIKEEKENKWFLPGIKLNANLVASDSFDIVNGSDFVVFAVPSQFMRKTAEIFSDKIRKENIVISVSKGIEHDSYKRMSEVLGDKLSVKSIVALSGPNHCEEVSKRIPTATVVASKDQAALNSLKQMFETNYFKVYTHDDLVGVEICGSIKNITAIATGVCDGLGLGDNAKASIITLGLTEMNRFGRHFGAERKTIYGLAGVGDLVATCTSKLSRNRFVGQKIAEGKSFDDIKKEMQGKVAEGVETAKSVYEFSLKNNVDMPLTTQVYKVLFEKKELKSAVNDLIRLI